MVNIIFWTSLLVCLGVTELKNVPRSSSARETPSDFWDDTCTVTIKAGYPCESHMVVTEDGYILTMHRIPYGKAGKTADVRTPVLLQHGLMSSSEDCVITPPERTMAFLMADAGYDVFMGNFRGNYYSHGHTTLDVKSNEYWHFSWDEMGKYDLPAFYDYILQKTGQEQLIHVGHSMGTTTFWVAMNERPEYNDKIKGMIAMGPVASVDNMKSPIRLIAPFVDDIEWMMDHFGGAEFMPTNKFMDWIGSIVCDDDFVPELCESALFLLMGFDKAQFNMSLMAPMIGSPGRGTSARTIAHYAQSVNNKQFCKYDFGRAGNMEHYGQETPPLYDLKKVTTPVALMWGENDWLADPADVMELASGLPNIMGIIDVDYRKWSHLDFLTGYDVIPLVYDYMFDFMSKM